jgi:hypothetical protein
MKVYVYPLFGSYMAVKDGHRRGPTYTTKSGASRVARRLVREAGSGKVLWLNGSHKVERVDDLDGSW